MRTFLTILLLATAATLGAEVSIQIPAETGAFKPGKGSELAQAQCLTCHSVEYVTMQPPMPRKFWEGNIKKMKEKFGAPIPDETAAALAEYLAMNYGSPDSK